MKGTSYTYFTTDNAKQARELIGILRESKSEVPPELEQMAMFSGGGGGRSTFSSHCLLLSLIIVQVVTAAAVVVVVVVVVAVADEAVEVGEVGVATMVVAAVAEDTVEDATGGEWMRSTAMIRLNLRNWSQFGPSYRSTLISP